MQAGEFTIAVLDGPFDAKALASVLERMPESIGANSCSIADASACQHGTFIIGLLAARRTAALPGLCPDVRLVHMPLFGRRTTTISVRDLTKALHAALDARATVINLSLAIVGDTVSDRDFLMAALDRAFQEGALLVTAAGNQGRFVSSPLLSHPVTVPVVAVDASGKLLPNCNLSPSIGRRGIAIRADDIAGYAPGGGIVRWSGTSVAAATATGLIAGVFAQRRGHSAHDMRTALQRLRSRNGRLRSLVPPMLTAATLRAALAMSKASATPDYDFNTNLFSSTGVSA